MAFGSAVNVNGCQRDSHGEKQKVQKISERDSRRKLVLEQAGLFPAKILGHFDQLGESILAKSTV